ncbi:helix-turn-helix domain-containing protein [Paraburkholderia sediminicola]|uniref:helix-turn-helix domain-containing protein n=1 Tax=Paraburkholderia sediminicola TaxID=458836 RepID=UPI0038B8A2C1
MTKPVDELRAAAARLKLEVDELVRKIEALSPSDVDSRRRDAPLTKEQILVIAQRAVHLYETQRSPRPVHVTITQAAAMLGLSRPTVSKMLKTGELRFNGCGRIPIEQIDMVPARSKR